MSYVYNLASGSIPVPVGPAISAISDSEPVDSAIPAGTSSLINQGCSRAALAAAMGGSGSYGIISGLDLSSSFGLVLSVSAGMGIGDEFIQLVANPTGPYQFAIPSAFSVTPSATSYIWLSDSGTLISTSSLSRPANGAIYLGAVTAQALTIFSIDRSGVCIINNGLSTRTTADTGAPTDIPANCGPIVTKTASGLYTWINGSWQVAAPSPSPWDDSAGDDFASAAPYANLMGITSKNAGEFILGPWARPIVHRPSGTGYYVSNSTANGMTVGSDSTGTGTHAAPWLTIDKALTSIDSSGDATIYVNDGTYAESSFAAGRLIPSVIYGDWVSVESLTGRPDSVTVTTTSSSAGAINCVSSHPCGKLQFRNLTVQPGSTQAPAFNVSSSNGSQNSIHFANCRIAGSKGGFMATVWFQGDGGFDDFALINCEFIDPVNAGAENPVMIEVSPSTIAGNGEYTNFMVWGCKTSPSATYEGGGGIYGVKNMTVCLNDFTASKSYGFLVGDDLSTRAIAWTEENVYIGGNRFAATGSNGHGLLLGFGCQATVVAEHNVIEGAVQGIVVKGASGAVARFNRVTGTAATFLNGIYAKASTGTKFIGNTVIAPWGSAFREDWDSSTSTASSGTVLAGNRLIASGSAQLLYWANTPDSTGSGSADRNIYELRDSATWGQFRSHTITSLADLQASWTAYGLTGDSKIGDANSKQNLAGSEDDVTVSATTGKSLYVRLLRSDGMSFTGFAVQPYDSLLHASGAIPMPETATSGAYALSMPVNLPPGKWQCVIQTRSGTVPRCDDDLIDILPVSYT